MAFKVEFRKSGKTVEWDNRFQNILELAEANGVSIDFECRIGVCGTCKTKLLSGEVFMEMDDGLDDEDRNQNMILPCVAIPQSDVVLDV